MKVRLVKVDAAANNNKYWFGDVEGRKFTRRWGRVGYKAQSRVYTYGCQDEAERKLQAVARKKRAKGYKGIDLLTEGNEVRVGNAALGAIAEQQIETNGSSTLDELVAFLVRMNVHQITASTSITYDEGQLKTALGVITPAAIGKARGLLDQIAQYMSRRRQGTRDFDRLVERYLMIVPRKVGMKLWPSAVFGSMDDVREQEQILDAMQAVASKVGEQVFEVSLEELGVDEVAAIQCEFDRTACRGHTSYGMKVARAFKAEIGGEAEAFEEELGNVWLLWHGTKASNLLSILRQGLVIVPSTARHTTGRMFGDGLYFSDQSTKALNYATTFWGGRDEGRYFMLLCKVAMGRAYTPDGYGTRRPPRGYDSLHAKGGQSGVRNNEMVVYRESQVKIEYIVEFKRR